MANLTKLEATLKELKQTRKNLQDKYNFISNKILPIIEKYNNKIITTSLQEELNNEFNKVNNCEFQASIYIGKYSNGTAEQIRVNHKHIVSNNLYHFWDYHKYDIKGYLKGDESRREMLSLHFFEEERNYSLGFIQVKDNNRNYVGVDSFKCNLQDLSKQIEDLDSRIATLKKDYRAYKNMLVKLEKAYGEFNSELRTINFANKELFNKDFYTIENDTPINNAVRSINSFEKGSSTTYAQIDTLKLFDSFKKLGTVDDRIFKALTEPEYILIDEDNKVITFIDTDFKIDRETKKCNKSQIELSYNWDNSQWTITVNGMEN